MLCSHLPKGDLEDNTHFTKSDVVVSGCLSCQEIQLGQVKFLILNTPLIYFYHLCHQHSSSHPAPLSLIQQIHQAPHNH
jgi:hypothetical protein